MPNYSTTSNAQYGIPQDPITLGARYGQAVGGVAGGIQSLVNEAKAEGLPFGLMEGTKAKASKLIAEYGDPSSETFKGLTGSQRTTRLVSLLQPLDPAMAMRYETRASEQRARDYGGRMTTDKTPEDTSDTEGELANVEKRISEITSILSATEQQTKVATPEVVAPIAVPSVPSGLSATYDTTTAQPYNEARYNPMAGYKPLSSYIPTLPETRKGF